VDYVYPGGSSLMDRGVYDAALLGMEYLATAAPHALAQKIADGYLRGVVEEAPGVIALNMRAASACVIKFIARMFPFRQFPNETRARSIFMLAEGDEDTFAESQFTVGDRFPVALGVTDPLLGLPALAAPEGRMKRRPLWSRRIVAALAPRRSLRVVVMFYRGRPTP
jgi:hypothetical protein